MCNSAWSDLLPESYYEYFSHASSDHAPIFMNMLEKQVSGHKPFKFFHYWMQCASYAEVVTQAWNMAPTGYPLFRIICKLKAVKSALKAWSKQGLLTNPAQHIDSIKKKLTEVHKNLALDHMVVHVHKEEVAQIKQLEHWLALEESQLKQKSREDWSLLGDKNSKFFPAMVKVRTSRNQNTQLINVDGSYLTNLADKQTRSS